MKFRFPLLAVLVVCISVFAYSCSGGSSNQEADVSSVGNINSTFNAIEGLLFDSSSTANAKLSTKSQAAGQNEFSFIGCHYKEDRSRMMQDIGHIRVPLCFISAMEDANVFSIPENKFGYYNLTGEIPGEEEGPPTGDDGFKIRIGRFDGCLVFQACDGGSQSEYFRACNTDGGISATAQHLFSGEFEGQQELGQGSLSLTALGNIDQLNSFELTTAFSGTFRASTFNGSATLTGVRATRSNVFTGHFSGSDTFQGQSFSHDVGVCVYAGDGTGSGRVNGTHTVAPYPYDDQSGRKWYCPPPPDSQNGESTEVVACAGQQTCTQNCPEESFDHLESFRIDGTGDSQVCYVIPDDDSPWYSLASACTPPAFSAPTSFTDTWDCQAPSGFTDINLSSIDQSSIQACLDLETGLQDQPGNCDQLRNEDEQENHQ